MSAFTTALTGGGGLDDGDKDKALLAGQLLSGIPAPFLGTMMSSATQANLPPAHLNFVFLNKDMEPVGPPQPIQIEENGYICVFLSSRGIDPGCTGCGDVYFDDLWMRVHRGAVKEEAHYYPHGLPMRALSAVLPGQAGNRHRYQGKEHIEELGLGWMDFHARQYDPQIGRFLSVDPLGDASGQETYGTYAAMGNMPESMIDPDGMLWGGGPPRWENPRGEGAGQVSSLIPNLHLYMPGGALFNVNTFASMMIRGTFSAETQSKINNQQSGSYTVPDISAMYGAGGATRCNHGGSSGGTDKSKDRAKDSEPERTAWDLDGDRRLSRKEMVNWRNNGKGRTIEVDASLIDIGYIDVSNLTKGQIVVVNLLYQRGAFGQGRVYGHLQLEYNGAGGFGILDNPNDYETGEENGFPWSEYPLRNFLTKMGSWIDGGKNGGIDFNIKFRGIVYPTPLIQNSSPHPDSFKSFGNW